MSRSDLVNMFIHTTLNIPARYGGRNDQMIEVYAQNMHVHELNKKTQIYMVCTIYLTKHNIVIRHHSYIGYLQRTFYFLKKSAITDTDKKL